MLADYTTGSEYRALDNIVKPLFDRLEEITQPDFAFNDVRTHVHAASDALRANFNREGVSGQDIVDKFQDYSKTYLQAAGFQFPHDELYASHMRQILGDMAGENRNPVKEATDAIKRGDIDDLAKLFKDAYVNYNFTAKLNPVNSKIPLLDSDKMQAFGKAAAQRIGAENHTNIVDNLPGYIRELIQNKANTLYN
jgi:hypothetical protein